MLFWLLWESAGCSNGNEQCFPIPARLLLIGLPYLADQQDASTLYKSSKLPDFAFLICSVYPSVSPRTSTSTAVFYSLRSALFPEPQTIACYSVLHPCCSTTIYILREGFTLNSAYIRFETTCQQHSALILGWVWSKRSFCGSNTWKNWKNTRFKI
jgi:hypothetical protein